jgi:hypothetical protein
MTSRKTLIRVVKKKKRRITYAAVVPKQSSEYTDEYASKIKKPNQVIGSKNTSPYM